MNLPRDCTERLRRADKAHVWHPFTQMAEYEPFIIEGKPKGVVFTVTIQFRLQ